jgi:hypothetical protein
MELVAVPHYRFGLESVWGLASGQQSCSWGWASFLVSYLLRAATAANLTLELLVVSLGIGEDPSFCGVETTNLLSCSRDPILIYAYPEIAI